MDLRYGPNNYQNFNYNWKIFCEHVDNIFWDYETAYEEQIGMD